MLNVKFTESERQAVVNMAVEKVCESGDLEWIVLLSDPVVRLSDAQRKQIHDAILTHMGNLPVARFIVGNPDS